MPDYRYTPQEAIEKMRSIHRELDTLEARDAVEGGLSAGQEEHRSRLNSEFRNLEHFVEEHRDRARRREQIGKGPNSQVHSLPDTSDDSLGSLVGAQERALRALERVSGEFRQTQAIDTQDTLIRKDHAYAWDFECRANPDYLSAFGKILRAGSIGDAAVFMSDSERNAMFEMAQSRALSEGVTTAGGMAVPVVLDPSVILTDQENVNPFLSICRTVDVVSNVWKGVSAAGVSWSFDTEAAEVSDDSITLAQPTVTVQMARGFIPYSIEVGEDWSGFQAEMARLLAAGYDELLLSSFTTGSGVSPNPQGILTKLDATAASESLLTTAGQFGQEDIYKAWAALPSKYQRNASWMMNVGVNNKIRQFGTGGGTGMFHAYTVSLPAGAADMLMGSPVYSNPYFADFGATTSHQNVAVVGDFSNMVLARRTGLSVELVPHLIGAAQRPTGSRGLFAYGRIGSSVVQPGAFRLINQT